jgi:predicted outer membrane protein
MKLVQCILIALLLCVAIACNTNKTATSDQPSASPIIAATIASADQQFLSDAAKGNRAEVELGKMMEKSAIQASSSLLSSWLRIIRTP